MSSWRASHRSPRNEVAQDLLAAVREYATAVGEAGHEESDVGGGFALARQILVRTVETWGAGAVLQCSRLSSGQRHQAYKPQQ